MIRPWLTLHYTKTFAISSSDRSYLFVVGVGRSGTTLIQSMLNAHPHVVFFPETQFLRKYLLNDGRRRTIESRGAGHFRRVLADDPRFARLGLSFESIQGLQQRVDVRTFYDAIAHQFAQAKHVRYVGDKDPKNIDHLRAIHRHFPQSRIIHIYRDPRAIVASKMNASWSSKRPYWQHAYIGQAQITGGRQVGKRLFGAHFYEVCYEQLLDHPQQVLSGICDFLNLSFSEQMLDFATSAKSLIDSTELDWKKNALLPIQKTNKDKWKTELNHRQAALIEAVSDSYFSDLAYVRYVQKPAFQERIWAGMLGLFRILFQPIYQHVLKKRMA